MKNVRSCQAAFSCTELSKTQFFPVSIVNLQTRKFLKTRINPRKPEFVGMRTNVLQS